MLSLSLSVSHTHKHTYTSTQSLTYTPPQTHTHTHMHTNTHTHAHTLMHSLPPYLFLSRSLHVLMHSFPLFNRNGCGCEAFAKARERGGKRGIAEREKEEREGSLKE